MGAWQGDEGRTGETPWGDDFDVGFETVKGELETDLVVAFAGAPVGDVAVEGIGQDQRTTRWWRLLASFLFRAGDHATGDDGASERGAEQVYILYGGHQITIGVVEGREPRRCSWLGQRGRSTR